MSNTAEDRLLSGGSPSCTFPTIGTTWVGTILSVDESQQVDFRTKEPKVWNDGTPMMQYVIELQTDVFDPAVPNDDGKRRLFCKGQMINAVRGAVQASGAKRMVGGRLAVQYSADGVPSEAGLNPPKQYVAEFQPGVEAPGLLGGTPGAPAPAGATAPVQPVPQPAVGGPGLIAQTQPQPSADSLT